MEYKTRIENNIIKSNWQDFCKDWIEFRKGYKCWKAAINRGYEIPLSTYFKDGKRVRVRLYKSKGRNYHYSKRNLLLSLATPKWVNIEELATIYGNTPKEYHVDHIIPLTHALVSGLNVPWNLQYLTNKENLYKGAKWDGTYDNNSWKDAFTK